MLTDVKGLGPKSLHKLQATGILTLETLAIQDPWLIEERLPFDLDATGAKLIVVDSLIQHFGAEFIGPKTLAHRQQIISHLLQLLIEYADVYQATVIYPNQVQDTLSPFGSPTKEAGGNILAYSSTYRIRMPLIKGEERRAKLRDGPDLPEEEATFYLTDVGLVDQNGLSTVISKETSDNGEDE